MSDIRRNTARAHKALKEFLGDERYREFLREKQKKDRVTSSRYNARATSITSMVNAAFFWGRSSRGSKYWAPISRNWREYCRARNIHRLRIFQ